MEKYKVKITDIIQEAPGTMTYLLEKPTGLTWLEGAHTHIGLLGFDVDPQPNKNWVHHMSIMTLPEDDKIGFTTRILAPLSEFKEKLSELQIGDEVILFKIGSRMSLRREDRPVILVSMGVGVATMRPLIHRFFKDNTHIPKLINININSSEAFVYKAELDNLADSCYQNYWMDSRGKFYETLDKVSDQADAIYYVVGSDEFIKDVIKYLRNKKVEAGAIRIDKKEEMAGDYFI